MSQQSKPPVESDALRYHAEPTPGKIAILSTKACDTAAELALAYSPGVSEPCLAIAADPELVYRYTSKGNLVAVISNGTAVLGLGNIGPAASKPVMEGKGILFKRFADIDVFDLELDCASSSQFIESVATLGPTFGGINLEDLKAPECFEIEEALISRLDIPVFHDDQHGTAIIAAAALLNALEVLGKDLKRIRLVVNGAGAAGIACAKLLVRLGLPREQITLCDTNGVVHAERTEGMNRYKAEFAIKTPHRTLSDAIAGADVFFGLSKKGAFTREMLLSMADNPIVFAMANPDPEIDYQLAKDTRGDCIIATGRSDYPNQVNNVLGFPFIFRGALDVRASAITEEMKLAAVYAIAALAKEPVPESVRRAYGNCEFRFGPNYLIPKPFDPRVLYYVAPAVAKAAIDCGVARKEIDLDEYTLQLKAKQNPGRVMVRPLYDRARNNPLKRIGFPEGSNSRVLTAAVMAHEERIARPVLIGIRERILAKATKLHLDVSELEIIEPAADPRFLRYVDRYYQLLYRKGKTYNDAEQAVYQENLFSCLMLAEGELDGLICGVDRSYPTMVKPILDIVGLAANTDSAAGLHIVSVNNTLLFFADTTLNATSSSERLADTAILAARFASDLGISPRVALLSFSNFGSHAHPAAELVRNARTRVKELSPELQIEGEMQVDLAMVPQLLQHDYPFCTLDGPANVLVFPDMQSGNIAYKLLQRLGGAKVVGPILLGLKAPAYVMQRHAGVDEIFNLITVAASQCSAPAETRLNQSDNRDSQGLARRVTRERSAPTANADSVPISPSLVGSTLASPRPIHRPE